jgi:formylglycine-generating enzyme required for sulfatase activity
MAIVPTSNRWWIIMAMSVGALSGCAGIEESGPTPIPPIEGLVFIPGGSFTMGSDEGPAASGPAHEVYLDPFWIEQTEVTMSDFSRYVEASGNVPDAWADARFRLGPNYPATGILWREAMSYCDWRGMRLPTEAEWEKAARGVDGRGFPWGRRWARDRANTSEIGVGGPMPVGSFPLGASPYGILDMSGNVQEWVSDRFGPDYYSISPVSNPTGPTEILDPGLRGGSWFTDQTHATTYFRNSSHSVRPNSRVGFRCALSYSSSD